MICMFSIIRGKNHSLTQKCSIYKHILSPSFRRNCIFKSVKLNESVSYFLSKNVADIAIRTVFFSHLKEYSSVEFTNPVSLYFFQVAQFLSEPTAIDRTDLWSFLIENKLLIFCVLIGYLVPLFAVLCSRLLLVRRRSNQRLSSSAYRYFFLNSTRMRRHSPKLARIFAFFGLFLFIMRTIITNLINTSAVVLDTSQFIDSRQRLFESPKSMVVCGNPLATNSKTIPSTEQSFTYKLFSQKVRENRLLEICFLKEDYRKVKEKPKNGGITSMFFYMNPQHSIFFMASFANGRGTHFIYMSPTSYNSRSVTLMIRRNLDPLKKQTAIQM